MPYSKLSELPDYIRKLPEVVQKGWMNVFNTSYAKYGESKAFSIANSWVKHRLKKQGDHYVGNSEDFVGVEIFSFSLQPIDAEFISNSEDGSIVLNAVLSSVEPWFNDKDASFVQYTESCLKDFESQINAEGTSMPDIDHSIFDEVTSKYANPDDIIKEISKRKGLLKDINAKFDDGKLFIKAKLDKRYKNYIDMYKALSIEVLARRNGAQYTGGKVLGFTFTNKPLVKSAKILSVE